MEITAYTLIIGGVALATIGVIIALDPLRRG